MVSYASLDRNGNLLQGAEYSYKPHKKDDPASITKVWALHTMIEIAGDKWPEFYNKNKNDIMQMMVSSNNASANKLACRLIDPEIKDLSNINKSIGNNKFTDRQEEAINKFVERMNEEADKALSFSDKDKRSTHFATVEGMPRPGVAGIPRRGHYSTAYDMAKLMYHFQKEHPQQLALLDVSEWNGRNNTGRAIVEHEGVTGFKTGTAQGWLRIDPDDGERTGLGATKEGGVFCVLGERSAESRIARCNGLADRINTGIKAEETASVIYTIGDGGKNANKEDVEAIKAVQKALGMKEEHQTGYFGPVTSAEVLKLQKNDNKWYKHPLGGGLPETGLLDKDTLAKIAKLPGADESQAAVINNAITRAAQSSSRYASSSYAALEEPGKESNVAITSETQKPELAQTTRTEVASQRTKTEVAPDKKQEAEIKPEQKLALTANQEKTEQKEKVRSDVPATNDVAKEAARPLAQNFRNNGVYDRGDGGVKGSKQDREVIKQLQEALGLKKEMQTGYYGDVTEAAVKDFQKRYNEEHKENKIAENGAVDKKTKELILKPTDVPKTMVAQANTQQSK